MKRLGWSFLGFAVAAFLIIGCDGTGKNDESEYSMKVLPSKLMIDVPGSLTSGTTGVSASVASTGSSSSSKFSTMKEWSSKTAVYAILADAAVVQASINPGESKTVDVIVTQDMVNAIVSVFSEGMVNKESVQVMVGKKVNVTVNYLSTPETGYDASVEVAVNDNDATTVKVSWSSDKKLSKVSVSADSGEVTVSVINDGNAKSSSIDVSIAGTCEIKLGAAEVDEGVVSYVSITAEGVTVCIKGFANDNGGYLKVDTAVDSLSVGVAINKDGTAVSVTDDKKTYFEGLFTKYSAILTGLKA